MNISTRFVSSGPTFPRSKQRVRRLGSVTASTTPVVFIASLPVAAQLIITCGALGGIGVAVLQPWSRLGHVEKRLDSLEDGQKELAKDLKELRSDMNAGFKELRAEMNAGFKELGAEMNAGFMEVTKAVASKPSRSECVLGLVALVAVGCVARSW